MARNQTTRRPLCARKRKKDVDQAKTSVAELREHAAGLRHAQLLANLAHVITTADGSFETWSNTLPQLLGLKQADIIASTREWLALVHPEDRGRFRKIALRAREKGTKTEIQYRLCRADGVWIHVRQVMEPLSGKLGRHGTRWFTTLQDVTDHVEALQRIDRLNRLYAVLRGINSALLRMQDPQQLFEEACRLAVADGKFIMAWIGLVDHEHSLVKPVAMAGDVRDFFDNAPMAILQTKAGGHGLAGRAVRTRRPVVSNDVKNDPQQLMRRELDERGINSLAIIPLAVRDQVIGTFALYGRDVGFFDKEKIRLLEDLARDLSLALDHIDKAKRLDYLSYYDALTGLPNRSLFHERLHMQLRQAAPENRRVALVILDVERFKTINDAFGRQVGDALLTQLAKRLQQIAQPTSWFARVGPDQFAIITSEVGTEDAFATRIERRLAETFGPPFAVADRDLRVSARVGVAIFPQDGADSDSLLRSTEAALKKAKTGGERYLFYRHDMTARVAEKLVLENKLRQALERQEFVLYYQPKVSIYTRTVVGLEALIRWKSTDLGLVAPAEFIPLLEETGLILQVGSWALKRASMDHRAWFEEGLNPPPVSVNVSAIQLRQREFVRNVRQAINVAVNPGAIELEITESNVMEDIQSSIRKLTDVRAIGLDIAIDDFGTGYSSLSYLAKLPVQKLKIDRSFVHVMHSDPTAKTLVETIIKMAHTLRLRVVAEGVETEAQLAVLAALGCDEMQGYLFSRPLPPEMVPGFFLAHHRA